MIVCYVCRWPNGVEVLMLFLFCILLLLLLFMVMLDVVRLEMMVVIFWYIESVWLCGV